LYVWRAVDSEGKVLDILVQPWRDRKAALKLMRKLLKKQGVTPVTIVTDKLGILQLCAARTWCCAAARYRSLEE
jgi:transposase-like protein